MKYKFTMHFFILYINYKLHKKYYINFCKNFNNLFDKYIYSNNSILTKSIIFYLCLFQIHY